MALIQINETWRIKSDRYNWTVQKYGGMRAKRPRAGSSEADTEDLEEYWSNEAYLPTLVRAARWLVERVQRDSDATTVQGIRDEAMSAVRDLDAALQGVSNVTITIEEK